MTDETTGRPGSTADLVRRVERLEGNLDTLTATVSRVELNQTHAEELNKLRFASLEQAVGGLTSTLGTFMARIEGMISGEVETSAAREGRALVADYKRWRIEVDEDREKAAVLAGRLDLLGKLAVILIGGQALAIVAALYALARA